MKRILLPALLILTLFLVSSNASAPTQDRYCGDMVCEQEDSMLADEETYAFYLYGVEHSIRLLSFPNNYTAIIEIDGTAKEMEEGSWYAIAGVPVRLNDIGLVYIGPNQSKTAVFLTLGEFYESCPADCGQGMCYDSDDGKDYYLAGVVSWESGTSQDYCIDDYLLKEYYCYQGVKSEEYSCPDGCEYGVCVQEIVEEEIGLSIEKPEEGAIIESPTDVSFTITNILDNTITFYPGGEQRIDLEVSNDTGGTVLWSTNYLTGSLEITPGTSIVKQLVLNPLSVYPEGPAKIVLVHYVREGPEAFGYGPLGLTSVNVEISKEAVCKDSDGGLDFNVKGTATDEWHSYTDKCLLGSTNAGYSHVISCAPSPECGISEAYCATPTDALYYVPGGGAGPAFVPCKKGCSDGACIEAGFCGNGACEIGESWENCPQDCQMPECPISIDLNFNKYDYYPGDYFEVTVKVYDKHYSLMPNRAFSVYNARQGVSTTFYTDSTGIYRSGSTIPQSDPSYNGEWTFTASVGEQNCPYTSDTETIYLHMEDNCGDGFCDEGEKELVCGDVCTICSISPAPAGTQTAGMTATQQCGCTTYCHVKCPGDCTPNCGNGVCDTVVCEALGCPVPENERNCPKDCREPNYCGSQSSDPNCICQEGYRKVSFEAPCQDLPVEEYAYTGTATQTAIQSTGFTQLGAPEEWVLGTDGILKLVLRNGLAQEVNVKSIRAEFMVGSFKLTTIFYTQNCRSNEIYMTIPPGGTVDVHSYCTNLDYNLIYPGAAAGVTYSVKLQILYNAGGYDRTDEGTLTGTVYSAGRICTDSDGGINYYVFGETSSTYATGEGHTRDTCEYNHNTGRNDILVETYCDSEGNIKLERYTCPNGCENGVCMQELMCTYYRCVPAYKYLYLYTDKYAYGINEQVQIHTNQFESGDVQLENIEVSVINPYGTRSTVTLVPVCDVGQCPPCQPGYYCPPCDAYTSCRYEGTFTGTGAVGTYRVEQLSEGENVVIQATSFRVYDYSLLAKYLILSNIDSYIYKESQLYPVPSPGNITGYFAVYEKDGRHYGVIVYSFETRDDLEALLNQGLQYTTPSEKRIDGYYIYVLDSYGQKAYVWTYKTFLLAVMENLPAHTLQAGAYISKTPSPTIAPSQPTISRSLGEQIAIEQSQVAESDFLTGMVTGMPVAGAPQPPYCGMDSMNSQCVCNAGENREEFTPPCPYSPCPTHYRCASPIPEVLIKAYLDKYPSDLKATGTECERNGGYCTEGLCSPEFEEADFACKTDYETCCIRGVDREDFLEIVMKLEGIRVRMDRLERRSIALSEYYDSIGDEERAGKFSRVAGMFAEAKGMVDDIVAKIRANLNNLEAIRNEIREDIQELRTYIRSILEEMVS